MALVCRHRTECSVLSRDKVLSCFLGWETLVDEIVWELEELLVFGKVVFFVLKEFVHFGKIGRIED